VTGVNLKLPYTLPVLAGHHTLYATRCTLFFLDGCHTLYATRYTLFFQLLLPDPDDREKDHPYGCDDERRTEE
jgi:hypothetical protein